ncbi:recombinase family protein, partial [Mesorhizobium sp. M2A.F.Ca.ET.042.01.1.1]|uniref:recombinase family protein n=1 Tax=Mesorhizobium sp. M2A.F.Ca.ET.042.01.1.1 TaxID=2496745 RepID=UPI000FD19958
LSGRARDLGWPAERIVVIDEDLGLSGSGSVMRDRLLLGLKGAMSEAELHVLRARLNGGIKNKAARGELRRGLPVGFVWGEADGEILFHPDEAVVHVIRTIFARFAELGSARRVWLWLRAHAMKCPLSFGGHHELRWSEASYHAVHSVLASPVYAGAYVYGKNRCETVLDETGARRKRMRKLSMDEWQVLIKDHHQGYIDWPTFETNQQRMANNTQPRPHSEGAERSAGAVREGGALLEGIARCGHCERR